MSASSDNFQSSVEDFHNERRTAALQEILARFTGKSIDLLSYGDVAASLKLTGSSELGLREIPVNAIVGSVGRYADFTRDFLPRLDSDQQRWARVKAAILGMAGLPPIEVYKIGDAYFVRDGHHRVSVARQLKSETIQAYVTEVKTRVPLTPETTPDQLILKAEYVDFLEASQLDRVIPGADLVVTVPGSYRKLLEHIQVHRYFMGLEQHREISNPEAVTDWYEKVYTPILEAIRRQGILRDFPGRTETDLYLWVSEHRYLLQKKMGWHIRSDVAASHLAEERSPRLGNVVKRAGRRLIDRLIPVELEDVPQPGDWRRTKNPESDCIFNDLLVPVSGEDEGWLALDQAIELARCERTYINGLYVAPASETLDEPATGRVKQAFEERCQKAGIRGGLAVLQGEISHQVLEQAVFNDIVILHVAHPPGTRIPERLGSGLRTIIRSCARPVLAVPGKISPLNRILLAYDGSIKAREALFLAAYFAGRWKARLRVLSSQETGRTDRRTLDQARKYLLKHNIQAEYRQRKGPAPELILAAAREFQSDLILMGGYGFRPVIEMVLGSSVDQVLRETEIPVLICQ